MKAGIAESTESRTASELGRVFESGAEPDEKRKRMRKQERGRGVEEGTPREDEKMEGKRWRRGKQEPCVKKEQVGEKNSG